jgi:hypothetical protein
MYEVITREEFLSFFILNKVHIKEGQGQALMLIA